MNTTKELTLESIASEASKFFVRKEREDKTPYYCCKDDTPDWIHDLVSEAHGGKLPDDYIYNWIDSALSNIATGDMTEDNLFEYADREIDCYTPDLTSWLNSRCDRVYYLTQAIKERGATDGFQALTLAQFEEIWEVFQSVLNSIQKRLEEEVNA